MKKNCDLVQWISGKHSSRSLSLGFYPHDLQMYEPVFKSPKWAYILATSIVESMKPFCWIGTSVCVCTVGVSVPRCLFYSVGTSLYWGAGTRSVPVRQVLMLHFELWKWRSDSHSSLGPHVEYNVGTRMCSAWPHGKEQALRSHTDMELSQVPLLSDAMIWGSDLFLRVCFPILGLWEWNQRFNNACHVKSEAGKH